MPQDAKLKAAAAKLDAAFAGSAMSFDGPALEGPIDSKELCKLYAKAKKPLEVALPLIALLPWGGPVVKAIKLLMKLADAACAV